MSLKPTVFALAALFSLAGCGPRPGSGTSVSVPRAAADGPLAADWLDGEASLSTPKVLRLFDLAARDPAAKAIVDDAVASLGKGSRDRLASIFRKCGAEVEASGEAGKTYLRWQGGVLSKDHASLLARAPSPELSAKIRELTSAKETFLARVEDHPDYVVVRRADTPTICLVAPMPIAAAYEAMIHELVHARSRQATDEGADPATFPNEAAYLTAMVLAPGDEVDAYVAASGARARLDGGTRYLLPPLAKAFDAAGKLVVKREDIAKIVLTSRPDGLGYADGGLRGAFERDKDELARLRGARRGFLEQLLKAKRDEVAALESNLGIFKHNVGVRRHNLDIARQKGDAAEVAKLTKGIAEDDKAYRETEQLRSIVREGVGRLEKELAAASK